MKFQKDIFISYAHLDDKPLDEGAKGWISDFHTLLETRLEQTIGHEILIWRDEKLTGNDVFAPEIESQLPALKVMVSIITPRYLDSDWCKREMGAFFKAANNSGGLTVGNKARIFKIVKTPVDREVIDNLPDDIHKLFDEILDYKFYFNEPGTGKFRELSRNNWVDQKIKQEYMNKLDDVVQDMANLIKVLNSNDKDKSLPEKKKIFLAETSNDLRIYRDNLVRELEEADFEVLPDKNLPYTASKFKEEVSAYIDQSVLALHMISSTNYAFQPEGVDKSIVILQNEIAAAKSEANGLKRLVWIPPGTMEEGANESLFARQTAFVNELQSNPEYQKGADILVGPLEEFKQAIFDTIRRMAAEEEEARKAAEVVAVDSTPAESGGGGGGGQVYLICNQGDLENTMPLEDFLADNGFEVLLPIFDGDSAQLRQAHRDNLKNCDAVIIFYGAGNFRWVGSMKSDLLRLPAMGRVKPLKEKLIYLSGPPDAEKEQFKSSDVPIVNGLNGFNSELFTRFIQSLK